MPPASGMDRSLKKNAAHCLLENADSIIDDSLANTTAARDLGFDVIHFRSPRQLRDELMNRGILP
jgi:hypothetical protein